MDCLTVRRQLVEDPELRSKPPEQDLLRKHLQDCESCARAVDRARAETEMLRKAVALPVPTNLRADILVRHAFREDDKKPRRRVFGIAASLLLASVLSIALWSYTQTKSMPEAVIALIHEAQFALTAPGPVAQAELQSALAPVGLRATGSLGTVTFASRCFVKGTLSAHIVLRGDTAPITIFLVPDYAQPEAERFQSGTLSGLLVPTESGMAAIVGAPGEALDAVAQRIQTLIRPLA